MTINYGHLIMVTILCKDNYNIIIIFSLHHIFNLILTMESIVEHFLMPMVKRYNKGRALWNKARQRVIATILSARPKSVVRENRQREDGNI